MERLSRTARPEPARCDRGETLALPPFRFHRFVLALAFRPNVQRANPLRSSLLVAHGRDHMDISAHVMLAIQCVLVVAEHVSHSCRTVPGRPYRL
ncbi:hypothetical protein Aduo_016004 [Ancylostoma duodenale]